MLTTGLSRILDNIPCCLSEGDDIADRGAEGHGVAGGRSIWAIVLHLAHLKAVDGEGEWESLDVETWPTRLSLKLKAAGVGRDLLV